MEESTCLQESSRFFFALFVSMPKNKIVRVAVVDSHPIQYHCQYYRLLASNPNLELTVFYCWDTRNGVQDPNYGLVKWDIPLLEGYHYQFIPNISPSPGPGDQFFAQINPVLTALLTRQNFDVVWIWGYSNVSAWLAVLTARLRGLYILFRGEAILDVPRSWWRRLLKEVIVRTFLNMVNSVAYSCNANKRYYQYYGVKDSDMFFSACAVDNRFFQAQSSSLDSLVCKKSLGLAVDQPMLLFVGRLDQRKRPYDLIRAVQTLSKTLELSLLLVGDGPLRNDLEDYCKLNGLNNIQFLGFRNQSELPHFYAAADIVLVMSSSDPSPKVLNEAMNFGVPVVVSDRVGTAGDLVIDGWNGFVVPFGDIDAIRKACELILTNPVLLQQMRANALQHINHWSFEKAAAAVENWLLNIDR